MELKELQKMYRNKNFDFKKEIKNIFLSKKEIKNLDNLTKVDFKNKHVEFKDEFISRAEVHSILSANFGRISDQWFKFSTTWNYNAYQTFMDMDKYLILIYHL